MPTPDEPIDVEALREQFLNEVFDEYQFTLDAEELATYAKACGETAPKFTDPSDPDFQAPPTFTSSLMTNRQVPVDFPKINGLSMNAGKSMEVKNQGGMRISVNDVDVADLEPLDGPDTSLTFRCRWRVSGWISHWGHVHRRANEHVAVVTIAPLENTWKITAIEMLDEKRVEPT